CPIPCSVMSRRPHQTKSGFALQRRTRCADCRTSRTPRVFLNIWIKWRIGVEIALRLHDAIAILPRMSAQPLRVHRGSWFPPFPVRMSLLQEWGSAPDPLRPLRVTGARIFQTAWVVKNRHEACKLAFQRIFDDHGAKRPENCSGNARV